MKYQYAPGLPGYGTQGADGSNGLLSLSTYFSTLNGDIDTNLINIKIQDNKILSIETDASLPGWPTRKYQTGDIFIDTNGKAYQINKEVESGANLFSEIGRINTSTIFSSGPDTNLSPVNFERYSNSYGTDKFLIDNVYTYQSVSNYGEYPTSIDGIYGIGARDYGQIKYVDISVNNYYPYVIYTNNIDQQSSNKAIAIVKDASSSYEHWRFGNYNIDTGDIRDVSLSMDFKNVNFGGNLRANGTIYGNIEGSITTENLALDGWLTTGDYIFAGSDLSVQYDVSIGNNLRVYNDVDIDKNLNIDGKVTIDQDVSIFGNTYTTRIYPRSNNSWDIGTNWIRYRDLFLSRNLEAGGNITSVGVIEASTTFRSNDDKLYLGTNDTGNIYIRPNGYGSATNQSIFSTSLATIGTNLNVSGTISGTNVTSGADPGHTHSLTGTSLTGTLPVSKGGTGAITFTSDSILTGNETNAIQSESWKISGSDLSRAGSMKIWPSNSGSGEAWDVTIQGGNRALAGQCGDVIIQGGEYSYPGADGGDVNIYGGDGLAGTADGGNIVISAGDGTSTANGGDVYIRGGNVLNDYIKYGGINIGDINTNYVTIGALRESNQFVQTRVYGYNDDGAIFIQNQRHTSGVTLVKIRGGFESEGVVKALQFENHSGTPWGGFKFNSAWGLDAFSGSDIRFKGDIKDISINVSELLNSFSPKYYKMREIDISTNLPLSDKLSDKTNFGYIAQDSSIINGMVFEDENTYLYVSKEVIIPYLHKAINEHTKILKDQQFEINNLKDIIEQQQLQINQLLGA